MFQEWYQNVMRGRRGADALSIALFSLFLLIALIGQLTDVMLVRFFSLAPAVWGLFRMLSRNTAARAREEEAFLSLVRPAAEGVKNLWGRLRDRKTHLYLKCPQCRQALRVPRGKGRIEITCPRCRTKMIRKT